MWIHENPGWNNFTWDSRVLAKRLAETRYRQGRLFGQLQEIGYELKHEANLATLTNDVVNTSAIEGENLDTGEVRSSIARRLGLDTTNHIPASQEVEAIVEITLDAIQNFIQPMTKDRLCNWHAILFPSGRSGMQRITVGHWRTVSSGPMQVVSGPAGRETVHFEAPAADRLETEMQAFLDWFNKEENLDPVLKAGIAHFWFVTIHPFEDGNGRIARAIGDMMLTRADRSQNRFYSLSSQIQSEREEYYRQLESQQRASSDITPWLYWFLECLSRAITRTESTLSKVLFNKHLWDIINRKPINSRQRKIITRMLGDNFKGFMSTSKYAKLVKCSPDTALRDIQDLQSRGILILNPGRGRSTSYRLANEQEVHDMGAVKASNKS
ncbi:MAG: Fic family protein [Gammaproteobacteria bacterium]|nr:Fic family protein [Gammaproteobacteria bacterium]